MTTGVAREQIEKFDHFSLKYTIYPDRLLIGRFDIRDTKIDTSKSQKCPLVLLERLC
jgi:hypothetical protein